MNKEWENNEDSAHLQKARSNSSWFAIEFWSNFQQYLNWFYWEGYIVCCFNLITAFIDWTLRNAILGVMTQHNWLMKPIYPNLSHYRLMSTEWQSLYSLNVEIKVISITIASQSIINSIDYEIVLYKPLWCLQLLNGRHLHRVIQVKKIHVCSNSLNDSVILLLSNVNRRIRKRIDCILSNEPLNLSFQTNFYKFYIASIFSI